MSRILHFADLHLETSFNQISDARGSGTHPRQRLRDCLHRIVDLALQHDVDVVTIGGDLYEHERRCADTGNFIRDELQRLYPTPVVIAPGNHDPYTPDSLYRAIEWPGNVEVLRQPALQSVDVAGDLRLWGAAFTNRYRRDCPLDGFAGTGSAAGAGGRTNVLLLHAAIGEPPSDYSPLNPAAVRHAGFALALLGHIHNRSSSRPDLGLYYPGSPEPLDFSESGDRHAILVDTDGDAADVRYLTTNSMRFGSLVVDVHGADSREAIAALALQQAEAERLLGGFARVSLVGTLHRDVDMDAVALRAALSPRFAFVDVADETEAPYDFDAEGQGYTTKARFVQRLRKAMAAADDDERQVLEEALVLGLRAFERRPLAPRQRLQMLPSIDEGGRQ